MEARKRKMEEGKIGWKVGRRARKKNGTNEGRDVGECARERERFYRESFSRERTERPFCQRANQPIDR